MFGAFLVSLRNLFPSSVSYPPSYIVDLIYGIIPLKPGARMPIIFDE